MKKPLCVLTFVHVEHFASQGALVPNWLGAMDADGNAKDTERVRLAALSLAAVWWVMEQFTKACA